MYITRRISGLSSNDLALKIEELLNTNNIGEFVSMSTNIFNYMGDPQYVAFLIFKQPNNE